MLKPLTPVIADIWAHDFNEMEHLSLVHAKYGSHHLQKEVADSSDNDDQNKKATNTLRSEDKVQCHILTERFNPQFNLCLDVVNFPILRNCNFSSIVIIPEGPPPKFSISSI